MDSIFWKVDGWWCVAWWCLCGYGAAEVRLEVLRSWDDGCRVCGDALLPRLGFAVAVGALAETAEYAHDVVVMVLR